MPAHRRPEAGATPARRRDGRGTTGPSSWWSTHFDPSGTRRSATRLHRNLVVALGALLLAIAATAGPTVVRNARDATAPVPDRELINRASVPDDDPGIGLVYEGLAPADRNAPCAGSYELVTKELCSHGPDLAPPGLSVQRDVAPVTAAAASPTEPTRETGPVPTDSAVIADEGGQSLAADQPALVPDLASGEDEFVLGPHGVACTGDGRTGKRVQVLYLHEFGTASRYPEYLGSFRAWAAGVDAIIDASAGETGGSRHVRFVTTARCEVDVAEVQVPADTLGTFEATIKALQKLGYNRTDRKYLLFTDAKRYCAIGTFVADDRAGSGNRNNGGPAYGRVDAGCWSAAMTAHQLVHGLGGIMASAPNASGAGHCTDDHDLMCWRDSTKTTLRQVCPDRAHEQRLDCNHDDYFHTAPAKGSYLDTHWNVAENEFLLAEKDEPRSVPTATRTTGVATERASAPAAAPAPPGAPAEGAGSPAPSPLPADPVAGPSVPKSPGAAPASGAPPQDVILESRNAAGTSVRLNWTAAPAGTRYAISVDGAVVGVTTATRARLVGMRPDTAYTVQVLLDEGRRPYTPATKVRSAPVARPADGAWFVLENALTGGSADLYAARTAAGTPIVLNRADGGSQQQWKLVPAGDDAYLLTSRATGRCVLPQGNNPAAGQPLVQAECTPGDSSQRWRVQRSEHGFSLGTTIGGLVVGAGEQRFGSPRLLVLQHPDGSRHQSWTAPPG